MLRLSCLAQNYEWGKLGSLSAVARLQSRGENTVINELLPYAEYWFGTHPSGPSRVHINGKEVLLQDWLLEHKEALGAAPYNSSSALPYLFKVLSVAKALSIQAHPDKPLAVRLHAARGDQYKDDNHKPEMACALTPFEAMCSFRPPAEIAANIRRTPELRVMLGGEAPAAALAEAADAGGDAWTTHLRTAFTQFMSQPDDVVKSQTAALASRLSPAPSASSSAHSEPPAAAAASGGRSLEPDAVALRLLGQFPGDVGVFAPYLLNVIRLAPGEAIFLGANEPHAYLDGDCVEVMACSDNVVRAGLTPKWKDVGTLCAMLTYASGRPELQVGRQLDEFTRQYAAPVPEFCLQRTELQPRGPAPLSYTLSPAASAAVIVVVEGEALATCTRLADGAAISSQLLEEGQVWLQPANVSVSVSTPKHLLFFRSAANVAM